MNSIQAARLTGVRREIKYLVRPDVGEKARELLLKKLPAKTVNGSASGFRVSIYLDDADRSFSAAEIDNQKVVTKLRVREYYVLDGSLPIFGEHSFIEVKTRSGQMVEKSRFAVDRRDIEKALTDGPPISVNSEDRTGREAFEEMRNGKPLHPIFVVHYRRFTLQDKQDRVRLTIDDMLSWHMPPEGLISRGRPCCSRKDLPPPFLIEPGWIIEVKSTGPTPQWLDEILESSGQLSYSKFGIGVRELERRNQLLRKGAHEVSKCS
jgi:hypothetical protein